MSQGYLMGGGSLHQADADLGADGRRRRTAAADPFSDTRFVSKKSGTCGTFKDY